VGGGKGRGNGGERYGGSHVNEQHQRRHKRWGMKHIGEAVAGSRVQPETKSVRHKWSVKGVSGAATLGGGEGVLRGSGLE